MIPVPPEPMPPCVLHPEVKAVTIITINGLWIPACQVCYERILDELLEME